MKNILQLSVAAVSDRRSNPRTERYATVRDRRYKLVVCALIVLTLPALSANASPDDEFQSLASNYIDKYLEVNPEQATQLGDHRFDDRLTDYSADAFNKELKRQKEFREKLNSLGDESQLGEANRIDFQILRDNVDYQIFQLEELKEWEWNPLVYNQSLADSIYLLVARDFAPAEKRIPNLKKRLEAIPTVIAQAEKNLKHPPRVHTETAIEQLQGAISLVREGLSPLLNQAPQLGKELAPSPGKNSEGAGRLQEMAAGRFAAALEWQLPHWRGEVSQEAALRARLRFIDRGNHEARARRSEGDTDRDL